jgi:ferrous iron transport protein B
LIFSFFILILEESGYLPRAAFLLDKLMSKAGLSGRSFIPLLSSFACAIPESWQQEVLVLKEIV